MKKLIFSLLIGTFLTQNACFAADQVQDYFVCGFFQDPRKQDPRKLYEKNYVWIQVKHLETAIDYYKIKGSPLFVSPNQDVERLNKKKGIPFELPKDFGYKKLSDLQVLTTKDIQNPQSIHSGAKFSWEKENKDDRIFMVGFLWNGPVSLRYYKYGTYGWAFFWLLISVGFYYREKIKSLFSKKETSAEKSKETN